MGRRTRTLLKKFALLCVSLLICFTLLEVGLRVVMKYKPAMSSYVVDFEVGKRLKPGFEGNHYGADVKISSLGLRDREFPREVPEGRTRVICLGDSWTFGTGVTTDQTWPRQLQAALNVKGLDVETVNTGVSGYETHQESIVYKRDHQHNLEHDLVVVGVYPVNDIHDKHLKHSRHKRLYDFHPLAYKIYTYPNRHLYTYQVYKSWKKARKHRARVKRYAAQSPQAAEDPNGFAAGEDDWTQLYRDDYAGWPAMKNGFRSIGETARENGVEVAVVLFPDLRDLNRYENYCHPKVAPRIREAVEDAGLHFIDLVADFAPYKGRETEIGLGANAGATHPGPEGYALIGRAVARELVARGLVKSAPVE